MVIPYRGSLIQRLLHIGLDNEKDELKRQRIFLVNCLSVTLGIMTVTVGLIYYLFSGEGRIMIPAAFESILAFSALYMNFREKHLAAALHTFFVQCAAALYFGLVLGNVVELLAMIIFLILLTYRLFSDNKIRALCMASAVIIFNLIKLGKYYGVVEAIRFDLFIVEVFRYIAECGVMLLVILIGRPYVQSNDLLILSNKFKQRFVAKICHEERNQINNITLAAEVLKTEAATNPELKKFEQLIDSILFSCNASKSIVNSVLSMTRIESGETDPIVESTFKADHFVREIIGVNRIAASIRKMRIEYSTGSGVFSLIKTDANKLHEIFTNLLVNAIKYGKHDQAIRVHRFQNDHEMGISVINKGEPIPPEKQLAIFEPYVTNKHNQAIEGTGLGLHIAQKTAETMGGKITLECSADEINFTMLVPVKKGEPKDVVPEKTTAGGERFNLKILVADDDLQSSVLLKRLIEGMGCQVKCVADGNQAIAALQNEAYDLVLTDRHMPNCGGLGLLQFVRENELLKDLPVILYSGEPGYVIETPTSRYAFDGELHKPTNSRCLGELLETYRPVPKMLMNL